MYYIENVFICLSAPILVAICCANEHRRTALLLLLAGMGTCLLSSYISTFVAMTLNANPQQASVEISPVIEETMKLIPILFCLLVFEMRKEEIVGQTLMVAVGFATLENACYLLINGAGNMLHLLIRGFSTGAMHVACGTITAMGLLLLWDRIYLRVAGTLGTLCLAITWHAIFNMLVDQTGAAAVVGYALPIVTGLVMVRLRRRLM